MEPPTSSTFNVQLIDDYVWDVRPAFLEQRPGQEAVLRWFEILADATGQLSPGLKGSGPRYPLTRGLWLRNIAAHAYLSIDLECVWEIVRDHLPALRTAAEKELDRPSA